MPNLLYCAHCDGVLIHRNVENRDLYVCPMCSSIYEKVGETYRHIATLSGGIAIKQLFDNIDSCKNN